MRFFPQYIKHINSKMSKDEWLEKISNQPPNVHDYDYKIKNISKNIIELKPVSSSFLYYNSFIPNVKIEFKDNRSPLAVIITFSLMKSIKLIISIFECVCAIFQVLLLITFFIENWHILSLVVVFIPIFMCVFSHILSYLGLRYSAFMLIKSLNIS